MDVLEKIFGSTAKVKIIKLFLFNPEDSFDAIEVAERAKVSIPVARREIYNMTKVGLLRPKSYFKEVFIHRSRKATPIKRKVNGWSLNRKFEYIVALESFLANMGSISHQEIVQRLSKVGKMQLVILSGIFIKETDSRVDLLVVADNLKVSHLENLIKTIESEIGKELRYAYFDTTDFNYRYSMFDKLIRDILDYPHQKIINKLNL